MESVEKQGKSVETRERKRAPRRSSGRAKATPEAVDGFDTFFCGFDTSYRDEDVFQFRLKGRKDDQSQSER